MLFHWGLGVGGGTVAFVDRLIIKLDRLRPLDTIDLHKPFHFTNSNHTLELVHLFEYSYVFHPSKPITTNQQTNDNMLCRASIFCNMDWMNKQQHIIIHFMQ